MPAQRGSHIEIVINSGLANKGISLVSESVDAIKVTVIPKAAWRRLGISGRVQGERCGQCEREQRGSWRTRHYFAENEQALGKRQAKKSCDLARARRALSGGWREYLPGSARTALLSHWAQCRRTNVNHCCSVILGSVLVSAALSVSAESQHYDVFVSNERSGDVTVIDGTTDTVVATFPVGKRPRGIHATPDGKRIFVALSGSPRMAPGVDENRAPADKRADGLGVIDATASKLNDRWHGGSDPEQFAVSKAGKFAFIANEDDASASIVDLSAGQARGKIKVSDEPEGVGVNPANGEVYVTCEKKGEVFAIDPDAQRVIAKIDTGGRPRSVAFLPDGSRAYVPCENVGYVAVIDAKSHKLLSKIQLPMGSLPVGTAISTDGKELYVSTGRGNAVAIIDTQKNKVPRSPTR